MPRFWKANGHRFADTDEINDIPEHISRSLKVISMIHGPRLAVSLLPDSFAQQARTAITHNH